MYTLFTRNYKRLFFLYDCIFTITLYVTVYSLGLRRGATEDLSTMSLCFIVFIAFYLFWDLSERKEPANTDEETNLYRAIIKWEWVTLAAFVGTYVIVMALRWREVAAFIFVVVLCGTTVRFALLTWRKRMYWYRS